MQDTLDQIVIGLRTKLLILWSHFLGTSNKGRESEQDIKIRRHKEKEGYSKREKTRQRERESDIQRRGKLRY